jgi:hypothetical protein
MTETVAISLEDLKFGSRYTFHLNVEGWPQVTALFGGLHNRGPGQALGVQLLHPGYGISAADIVRIEAVVPIEEEDGQPPDDEQLADDDVV